VLDAVRHTRPDAIINELTSLPKRYTPQEMQAAGARDTELRVKGNANLLAAARATNCRAYLLQSSAFWYAPGPGLADETASFAFDASPGVAAGCRTYADLEAAAQESGLSAVLLRYGFFYGPGTWFSREGDVGGQVRRREVPVIGKGEGIWSWAHSMMPPPRPVPHSARTRVYITWLAISRLHNPCGFPRLQNSPAHLSRQSSRKRRRCRTPDRTAFTMPPGSGELRTGKQKIGWHSVRDLSNGCACEQHPASGRR
jgi:hypothetical protein